MINFILLSITILLSLAAIVAFTLKRKTLAVYILATALVINLFEAILTQQDWLAAVAVILFVSLVVTFSWKNDIQVLIKALYATCLALMLFQKVLLTFAVFAGVMFLLSLMPRSKEEALPKKLNIGLSVLVIVLATLMTLVAVFGHVNVSLALSAYATLTIILILDIRQELKATP